MPPRKDEPTKKKKKKDSRDQTDGSFDQQDDPMRLRDRQLSNEIRRLEIMENDQRLENEQQEQEKWKASAREMLAENRGSHGVKYGLGDVLGLNSNKKSSHDEEGGGQIALGNNEPDRRQITRRRTRDDNASSDDQDQPTGQAQHQAQSQQQQQSARRGKNYRSADR